MGTNKNLHKAKSEKNDEFYTRYDDIAKEIVNYPGAFKGQRVYCPCDHYLKSNFVKYFKEHFQELGLRHLTSTHINLDGTSSERYDYDGVKETVVPLLGNGDFRSEECTRILNDCGVVVTNPPFSLFREFVSWLNMKMFLIIGNTNAIKYKEIFPLIKNNDMWVGCSSFNCGMYFDVPSEYSEWDVYKGNKSNPNMIRVSSICWFTNIDHKKRHIKLELYNGDVKYDKFDNYDAINIPNIKMIPDNYSGVMGVPITFIGKFNPNQFELVDLLNRYTVLGTGDNDKVRMNHSHMCNINGKPVFSRVLIRSKQYG